MYFSKIQINDIAKEQNCFFKKADTYDHHQFIWRFFNASLTDKNFFLYHVEDIQQYCFYTVSKNPPIAISPIWDVETKNYQPKITKGEKLQFKLRLNPVINQCRPNQRGKRHDLVMNMKKQNQERNHKQPLSILIHEAGKKWLSDRCEKFGFLFDKDNFVADRYQVHRFFKKQGQKEQISFSSLDLRGILTVTDEELFRESLFLGVGAAKRFGCGLLMVKRENQ